ncbi:unnamed protein product [Amoebophrya sp. A120]|nr:unnamed protein product [Amoebophrya sp. A120]|eukprot:GSA120T00009198001.1
MMMKMNAPPVLEDAEDEQPRHLQAGLLQRLTNKMTATSTPAKLTPQPTPAADSAGAGGSGSIFSWSPGRNKNTFTSERTPRSAAGKRTLFGRNSNNLPGAAAADLLPSASCNSIADREQQDRDPHASPGHDPLHAAGPRDHSSPSFCRRRFSGAGLEATSTVKKKMISRNKMSTSSGSPASNKMKRRASRFTAFGAAGKRLLGAGITSNSNEEQDSDKEDEDVDDVSSRGSSSCCSEDDLQLHEDDEERGNSTKSPPASKFWFFSLFGNMFPFQQTKNSNRKEGDRHDANVEKLVCEDVKSDAKLENGFGEGDLLRSKNMDDDVRNHEDHIEGRDYNSIHGQADIITEDDSSSSEMKQEDLQILMYNHYPKKSWGAYALAQLQKPRLSRRLDVFTTSSTSPSPDAVDLNPHVDFSDNDTGTSWKPAPVPKVEHGTDQKNWGAWLLGTKKATEVKRKEKMMKIAGDETVVVTRTGTDTKDQRKDSVARFAGPKGVENDTTVLGGPLLQHSAITTTPLLPVLVPSNKSLKDSMVQRPTFPGYRSTCSEDHSDDFPSEDEEDSDVETDSEILEEMLLDYEDDEACDLGTAGLLTDEDSDSSSNPDSEGDREVEQQDDDGDGATGATRKSSSCFRGMNETSSSKTGSSIFKKFSKRNTGTAMIKKWKTYLAKLLTLQYYRRKWNFLNKVCAEVEFFYLQEKHNLAAEMKTDSTDQMNFDYLNKRAGTTSTSKNTLRAPAVEEQHLLFCDPERVVDVNSLSCFAIWRKILSRQVRIMGERRYNNHSYAPLLREKNDRTKQGAEASRGPQQGWDVSLSSSCRSLEMKRMWQERTRRLLMCILVFLFVAVAILLLLFPSSTAAPPVALVKDVMLTSVPSLYSLFLSGTSTIFTLEHDASLHREDNYIRDAQPRFGDEFPGQLWSRTVNKILAGVGVQEGDSGSGSKYNFHLNEEEVDHQELGFDEHALDQQEQHAFSHDLHAAPSLLFPEVDVDLQLHAVVKTLDMRNNFFQEALITFVSDEVVALQLQHFDSNMNHTSTSVFPPKPLFASVPFHLPMDKVVSGATKRQKKTTSAESAVLLQKAVMHQDDDTARGLPSYEILEGRDGEETDQHLLLFRDLLKKKSPEEKFLQRMRAVAPAWSTGIKTEEDENGEKNLQSHLLTKPASSFRRVRRKKRSTLVDFKFYGIKEEFLSLPLGADVEEDMLFLSDHGHQDEYENNSVAEVDADTAPSDNDVFFFHANGTTSGGPHLEQGSEPEKLVQHVGDELAGIADVLDEPESSACCSSETPVVTRMPDNFIVNENVTTWERNHHHPNERQTDQATAASLRGRVLVVDQNENEQEALDENKTHTDHHDLLPLAEVDAVASTAPNTAAQRTDEEEIHIRVQNNLTGPASPANRTMYKRNQLTKTRREEVQRITTSCEAPGGRNFESHPHDNNPLALTPLNIQILRGTSSGTNSHLTSTAVGEDFWSSYLLKFGSWYFSTRASNHFSSYQQLIALAREKRNWVVMGKVAQMTMAVAVPPPALQDEDERTPSGAPGRTAAAPPFEVSSSSGAGLLDHSMSTTPRVADVRKIRVRTCRAEDDRVDTGTSSRSLDSAGTSNTEVQGWTWTDAKSGAQLPHPTHFHLIANDLFHLGTFHFVDEQGEIPNREKSVTAPGARQDSPTSPVGVDESSLGVVVPGGGQTTTTEHDFFLEQDVDEQASSSFGPNRETKEYKNVGKLPEEAGEDKRHLLRKDGQLHSLSFRFHGAGPWICLRGVEVFVEGPEAGR